MGRKDGTKDIMTRLPEERDAALIEWLSYFAEYGRQGDLVRLALYLVSGLEVPTELRYLMSEVNLPVGAAAGQMGDGVGALAPVLDKMADAQLRLASVLENAQRAPVVYQQPAYLPEEDIGIEASSGLDASRPRKKAAAQRWTDD